MWANKKKEVQHQGHDQEAEPGSVSRQPSTVALTDGQMATYEQQKKGLSAYYDKRWVLPDEIHRADRVSHDISRRKLCIWRQNQQLFAHEPSFRTVVQVLRMVWKVLGQQSF